MTPQTGVLPLLRPDIELRRGPDESDGSPTYIIHDPLQGTFEKATWVQARILRLLRVPQTVDRILQYLRRCTTIRVTPQDICQLCADASRRGLCVGSDAVAAALSADSPGLTG